MTKVTVKFASMQDAKHIVDVTQKCDCDVDLACGRYIVDAKSILGLFSLPQFENVELIFHSDDVSDKIEALKSLNLVEE